MSVSLHRRCFVLATGLILFSSGGRFDSKTIGQEPQTPAGFTALFNGKDLSGWYGWGTQDPNDLWSKTPEDQAKYKKESIEGGLLDKKGKPIDEHINAHWSVQNGELVNDGHGLYLTTDKDYGDFELMVEYKALP